MAKDSWGLILKVIGLWLLCCLKSFLLGSDAEREREGQETETDTPPLSSAPCSCALSFRLLADWSSKIDDFILCTQVL